MYYLKLNRTVLIVTQPGFSVTVDTIGPFENSESAHQWYMRNTQWLADRGVEDVRTHFMTIPTMQGVK